MKRKYTLGEREKADWFVVVVVVVVQPAVGGGGLVEKVRRLSGRIDPIWSEGMDGMREKVWMITKRGTHSRKLGVQAAVK